PSRRPGRRGRPGPGRSARAGCPRPPPCATTPAPPCGRGPPPDQRRAATPATPARGRRPPPPSAAPAAPGPPTPWPRRRPAPGPPRQQHRVRRLRAGVALLRGLLRGSRRLRPVQPPARAVVQPERAEITALAACAGARGGHRRRGDEDGRLVGAVLDRVGH